MRPAILGATVLVAALVPQLGKAQAFRVAEAPPQVTAANADWQLNGSAVFYAGDFYYPSGPTVYFDPYVMVRTGTYEGVPLYSDTTLEPYSIVYVPIGGKVMRPYEKRRAGTMEGTVGSRTPSFPVERDVEVSAATGTTLLQYPPRGTMTPENAPEAAMPGRAVGTGGTTVPTRRPSAAVGSIAPAAPPRPTYVESIPGPRSNSGVWLEYDGAKWSARGAAVKYVPSEFVRVGEYQGFPVFRDRRQQSDAIYIPSVEGGPLTPYRR